MSRKLSWFLFILASLIWATVFFQLSAFAADDVIWTENIKPFRWSQTWGTMSGCPETIEMKPTMLAPKGAPSSALKPLLTRIVGAPLGGLISKAGIVYSAIDLEGRRQAIAYAYEQLSKNGQPVTIDMVNEWIAAQNGIDTTGSVDDNDPSDGSVTYDGVTYNGLVLISGTSIWSGCGGSCPSVRVWVYNNDKYIGYKVKQYSTSASYSQYRYISTAPATSFNPANYPEIFGPDFFPSQAIDALISQGLDSFDVVLDKVDGDLDDHNFVDIDAAADDLSNSSPPGFWDFISKGLRYSVPEFLKNALSDLLPKISVDPTYTVQTPQGGQVVAENIRDLLRDWSIPDGSTILNINTDGNTVTYVTPEGDKQTKIVDRDGLQQVINNSNVTNNDNRKTTVHQEISLPEVHVSGSLETHNGTIDPVSEDRVEAAKQRFLDAWDGLKASVSGLFTVNLSGTGRLPVWHWLVLGRNVTIDFNQYANQLNWLSLAFVFLCTLGALFLVFGK